MLEQILDFIHNYFEKEIHIGKFKIESGSLVGTDYLLPEQYYRIRGSVFNDGIHQNMSTDILKDEEFDGEVWALAIPPAVQSLAADIENYMNEYGSAINGPFQSESFGGYSYSKGSGTDNHGNDVNSWQSKFAPRLNHWRKIS